MPSAVRPADAQIDSDADINFWSTTNAKNGRCPEDIQIEDANGNILYDASTSYAPQAAPTFSISAQPAAPAAEPEPAPAAAEVTRVRALYDYTAEAEGELSIAESEELDITEKHTSGWWYARNASGQSGFIPQNYVEEI